MQRDGPGADGRRLVDDGVPLPAGMQVQGECCGDGRQRNDLQNGDMRRMAAEKYGSLKKFAAIECGRRGQMHGKFRDRMVEIAVEEFPCDAPEDRCLEVLQARLRRRVKDEYGSIIAMLLISVLANLIARAVWEWWKKNHAHKALMRGWQEQARAEKS